ncbi:MAG: hypothetical protein M1816_004541 [Peltula sp. TS41687]|nr:MAG: hypothetical protein M1816_004541 [Peltula sp. TS41687]
MQGFNMGRYVPPEHEGTTSGNKLAGKHALGARARKLPQGILTVRFEMPFAVWCNTCPKPTIIGQGVRFNAEKKKVGTYYSTPIYSFRMKHGACGGSIEIRTDPQNTAYVVTDGGKKRDTGEDKELEEGEFTIRTEEERERLRNDAFAALEGKVEDKRRTEGDRKRIEELKELRERDWKDPYVGSQKLRRTFRAERKVREKNEEVSEALKAKMGVDIELLDETEEDRMRAGLIEFGDTSDNEADRVRVKPLFSADSEQKNSMRDETTVRQQHHNNKKGKKAGTKGKSKDENAAAKQKVLLQKEIRGNTLAAIDPFVNIVHGTNRRPPPTIGHLLPGMKRKQYIEEERSSQDRDKDDERNNKIAEPATAPSELSTALVDYDTD